MPTGAITYYVRNPTDKCFTCGYCLNVSSGSCTCPIKNCVFGTYEEEGADAAFAAVEKLDREWPPKLLEILVNHCKANRNEIWKLPEPNQRLFWDMQKKAAKTLYDMQMSYFSIEEFLRRAFNGKDYAS